MLSCLHVKCVTTLSLIGTIQNSLAGNTAHETEQNRGKFQGHVNKVGRHEQKSNQAGNISDV